MCGCVCEREGERKGHRERERAKEKLRENIAECYITVQKILYSAGQYSTKQNSTVQCSNKNMDILLLHTVLLTHIIDTEKMLRDIEQVEELRY